MFKKLTIALAAMMLVTGSAFAQGLLGVGGGIRLGATTTTASTCNSKACVLTTSSLTNGTSTEYTVTITNSEAASTDVAICQVIGGTNTGGQALCQAVPGSGSVAVEIANVGYSAFNGTVKFVIWLLKP